MRRVTRWTVLVAVVVLGCGAPNFVPVHNPVATVRITPALDTIPFGGAVTLKAVTLDVDGQPTVPDHRAVWTSLDLSILRVDTLGNVAAVWYGKGTIHAVVDGVGADASIVVRTPPITTVTVAPVGPVERGDTVRFGASARNSIGLPALITGIQWSSSDTTRLRFDSTGRGIAVGIGAVRVTATVDSVSGSEDLTVLVPTATVTVVPDTLTLGYDDTARVSVVARDSAGHVLTDRRISVIDLSAALVAPPSVSPPDSLMTIRGVAPGPGGLIVSAGHASDTLHVSVGALSLRSVAPGGWFTCAVAVDSAAFCWGWGKHGELGTGDTLTGPRPRRVTGGLKFASLSAGSDFACGLTGDGTAWCWGDNNESTLGYVGPSTSSPVPVTGGHHFNVLSGSVSSFLDLSQGTTCGQAVGGAAYCWGSGWGTTPVVIDSSIGFDRLSVGGGGYCGSSAADTTIRCWTAAVPTATPRNLGVATSLQTAPAWAVACGIASSGLYCWGSWAYLNNNFSSPPPGPLYSAQAFLQTTSGYQFFCGRTATGQTQCRGDNSFDQLGSTTLGFTDSLVAVPAPVAFTSISAGEFHACGFGTDGRLYCWGENDLGQSGSVQQYPHNFATPQPVFGQP